MAGKQRILKQRIRSTQTLQKIFRAMEMIAASRVGKAREAAVSLTTYDSAIAAAVAAVSAHVSMDHPLTEPRHDTNRVAVLVVAADRGMAGAYTATVLRETERLMERLREEGKDPVLYVCGRRAVSYFTFRHQAVEASWTGESDRPSEAQIDQISKRLLADFLAPAGQGGVSELYLVYTKFKSMVTQSPQVRKMLPITVIDPDEEIQIDGLGLDDENPEKALPLYEFEPDAQSVLDLLLPAYVQSRIRTAMLHAAASELASRQNAMHTATDNAEELIRNFTREANHARQAEITQEITEIVSGADALEAAQ